MEMKWKIGSVEMENPFILAPMAGVTDLPFRMLCKEQGAGLLCTEMVSAKAISFHNKNTISLMQIDPSEHPVSMQIFGSEPDLMAEVAKSIEEQPFDILDINMGCPVRDDRTCGKRKSMDFPRNEPLFYNRGISSEAVMGRNQRDDSSSYENAD